MTSMPCRLLMAAKSSRVDSAGDPAMIFCMPARAAKPAGNREVPRAKGDIMCFRINMSSETKPD